jgi:hypothetical protein
MNDKEFRENPFSPLEDRRAALTEAAQEFVMRYSRETPEERLKFAQSLNDVNPEVASKLSSMHISLSNPSNE